MARLGVRGISAGTVTRAHEPQRLHDRKASKDGPDEEAKGDSRLDGLAEVVAVAGGVAPEDGHGDGAGEPEDGGDGEDDEGGEVVVEALGEEGHEGEVEEHQDGPDGAEEHEGEGGGGVDPVPSAVAVCRIDD
jgi:hypothetical protein